MDRDQCAEKNSQFNSTVYTLSTILTFQRYVLFLASSAIYNTILGWERVKNVLKV